MRISPLALFVLLIIFFPVFATAQQTSPDSVQKKILDLYDEGNYSKVISYGEKVLRNGYDIYAVRNSLGKAYYKRRNYFKAIPNFERAAKLSYNDPENTLYLYNSYDITGREEDKNYVYYQLPKSVKKKLRPMENSFAADAYAGIGSEFTNDFDVNSSAKLGGDNNFYGEQVLNGDVFYLNLGIHQIPLRWIRIAYEYSYRNYNRQKVIEYLNQKFTDDYSKSENRFYNQFNFRVQNGLSISPAGHYIGVSENTIFANTDSIFNMDTLSAATVSKRDLFDDNFVLSVMGKKFYKNMEGGLNLSFSYLNHDHQTQLGAFFKYFLYPSAKAYAGATLTMHMQEATRIVFEPYLGGRVDDKLSGNIFFTLGTMVNFNNQNGRQVFNNGDKIKFRLGANVDYLVKFNLHAYLRYNYQYREKEYITSVLANQNDYQMSRAGMKYDVNDFSIGALYNF